MIMGNWVCGIGQQPLKRNLGLQLMSSVAGRNAAKPLLANGGSFHRDCGPACSDEVCGDGWIGHRNSKMVHMMPLNPNYSVLPGAQEAQALPMLQPLEPPKDDKIPLMDDAGSRKEAPLKKKAQAKAQKQWLCFAREEC